MLFLDGTAWAPAETLAEPGDANERSLRQRRLLQPHLGILASAEAFAADAGRRWGPLALVEKAFPSNPTQCVEVLDQSRR